MAEKTVWLLVGLGVGVGLAAGAWWLSRQNGGLAGLQQLRSEPVVRQHVVHRNDDGLIEAVETSTFPGSTVGGELEGDIEVVQDG